MDLRWSLLGLVACALFVKITRSKDRPTSPNNKNNMDLSKPQVGASSSSSSSPSSTHSFTHDVFLSFRGEDTRYNFTGYLHSNLVNKGIKTFIDNELTRGEDIRKELLEVIEGSRISIVVFSTNYASSKWCLDELVKIFQCKESKQQIVYPIFYKVDPSDIRHQKGQVGAHLSKYKDNKKLESWKAALTQAADSAGWHIPDGSHEATFIDEIVKHISTKIMRCTPLNVATHPVGIEFRVKDILKLLNVGQDKPHMVGIWGIGGIGKSTLAKAVYNSISNKFEHSCFLANVREESSSPEGLVKLQNNFLSKIIERNPPNVTNVDEGISQLKQKLSQKMVLLVLDDVDHLDQLTKLVGGCDWFGRGSKIIITTRDTNLLSPDSTYEVKELNHEDASKLFNFYAFKGDICPDGFFELANEVIHYAKGIPLVLEVLGSDLCSKKDKDVWKAALEYYRGCPNEKIQKILQRSYDGLHYQIQEVFLHIACFFKGDEKSYVIDVLQSCGLNPMYTLKVLIEKALIKIEKDNWIWMHDLIKDMGKEIVRQESPYVIGQRSRLWLYEDAREVLEENTGTDKIKAIVLKRDWNSQKIQLNGRSFTNLKNLEIFKVHVHGYEVFRQILKADDYEMLSGESVDYLPNQLRVLHWSGCSLRSLPRNFNPTKLGMLEMSGPCTTPLGLKLKEMRQLKSIKLFCCDGLTRIPDLSGLTCLKELDLSYCKDLDEVDPSVGRLDKLVHLRLSGCDGLTRIPDLSGLTCLKELDLSFCKDLDEVDPSVGRLDKLVYLRLSGCKKLQMFPKVINLKSLETLNLSDCPLELFPEIEGDMKSLEYLNLSRTAIKELPCSVENLTGLQSLCLSYCPNLTNVPSSIFYGLQRLEDLNLEHCKNLVTFPTKSESLPPPVFSTNLTRLQVRLNNCFYLKEISEFPREIDSLDARLCELERISNLSKILEGKDSKMFGELDLTGCQRLFNNLARRLVRGVEVDKRLFQLANKRIGPLMEEFHLAKKRMMEEYKRMMEEFHLANKRTGGFMEEAEEELMEEAEEEEAEEDEAEEELMEEAEEEEAEAEEGAGAESEDVKLTALLTLFFSCAKSEEFQVTFPARASLPNWFTCRFQVTLPARAPPPNWFTWRQDVNWDVNGKVINKEHEFFIEIPQNSNYKGLALCIQWNSDEPIFPPDLTHFVYINGIEFDGKLMYGHQVWVHYIPFVTEKKRLSESGISSPDMFRVMFRLKGNFTGEEMLVGASWGVHLIEDLEGEGR